MARFKQIWQAVRIAVKNNRWTRNTLTFIGFVALAALFWFIMALNDNVQDTVEVKINVTNVPDTVTFINMPTEKIHVTVRDRGTSLLRTAAFETPVLSLNFNEFSQDGTLRVNRSEILAALKRTFGNSASIASMTLDSLHCVYTTNPGKRVPVVVCAEVSARSGMVVAGKLIPDPMAVKVYSSRSVLDTVLRVYTEIIHRRNLEDNEVATVKLRSIPGARIIPDQVKVKIPVEPLVKKTQTVTIQTDNVPEGMDLLLFPQSVKVVYYVQMSKFNDDNPQLDVRVDYRELNELHDNRLPLHLTRVPDYLYNAEVEEKTVEYTIVKH